MARGESVTRALDALLHIAVHPSTQTELSERYRMTSRNVRHMLDSIEAAGVELDRGRGPVSLTEGGRLRLLRALMKEPVCQCQKGGGAA